MIGASGKKGGKGNSNYKNKFRSEREKGHLKKNPVEWWDAVGMR